MRLLLCILSAMLAMGVVPAAVSAQEPLLTIEQVDTLQYRTPVYGYSTLDPTGPKRFEGSLLGVLRNFRGPGHSGIAVELTSLDVVAAGQSGSPMYVDVNGVRSKIGTLSFGEPGARNPICFLTPIHEVLDVESNASRGVAVPSAPVAAMPNLLATLRTLLPLGNPMIAMLDEGVSSGVVASGVSSSLEAGSVLGVQLAWGDFDLTGFGTVSHVDGDKIFMLGHPMLQLGPSEYRLVPAKVLAVQKSFGKSHILAAPIAGAEPIGVIVQDRETAIYGVLGRKPETAIPVVIDLITSNGQRKTFAFFSVADPSLAPFIIGAGVDTAIQTWSRDRGDKTLFVNGKLEIDGVSDIEFSDSFTSASEGNFLIGSPQSLVTGKTSSVLTNRYSKAKIKKVSIAVKVFDEYRRLSIDSATLDRPNFKPGDTAKLQVTLSQPLKDPKTVTLEVPLPADLQYGVGKIVVGDAETINASESTTGNVVNLASLAESLSAKRRPDAVYVYVVLPPSKIGPPSSGAAVPMQVGDITAEVKKTSKRLSSNVEEYQVVVGDFQVSGKKEVEFKIGTTSEQQPATHP